MSSSFSKPSTTKLIREKEKEIDTLLNRMVEDVLFLDSSFKKPEREKINELIREIKSLQEAKSKSVRKEN